MPWWCVAVLHINACTFLATFLGLVYLMLNHIITETRCLYLQRVLGCRVEYIVPALPTKFHRPTMQFDGMQQIYRIFTLRKTKTAKQKRSIQNLYYKYTLKYLQKKTITNFKNILFPIYNCSTISDRVEYFCFFFFKLKNKK